MKKEATKAAELAAAIRAERARIKMSQQELADRVEVSRPLVSEWESGETSPRHTHLVKLSGVFKKPIHEWLPE